MTENSLLANHVLPSPFNVSIAPLRLFAQGAEALLYKTVFLTSGYPAALKYRFPKTYRHPTLDKRLTRTRCVAEARTLVRCLKEGVGVPGVLAGDWDAGWILLEWIEGKTVRMLLDLCLSEESKEGEQVARCPEIWNLMVKIGEAIGRMHNIGVIHGDLTTSNLMVRPRSKGILVGDGVSEVVELTSGSDCHGSMMTEQRTETLLEGDVIVIDFGLSTQSIQDEDKAVDLYVLQRAFSATHAAAEPLFARVLQAYGESYKGGKRALVKLEDVRRRGRKRNMIG